MKLNDSALASKGIRELLPMILKPTLEARRQTGLYTISRHHRSTAAWRSGLRVGLVV